MYGNRDMGEKHSEFWVIVLGILTKYTISHNVIDVWVKMSRINMKNI